MSVLNKCWTYMAFDMSLEKLYFALKVHKLKKSTKENIRWFKSKLIKKYMQTKVKGHSQ